MSQQYAYSSIVDPGHASTLWNLKDAQCGQEHGNYQRQMARAFRFNLLFRKFITVRHIDLFNNPMLMKFMETEEAGLLCRAGILKVTVPDDRPLRDLFDEWAFRRSSQHWHHLSAAEQREHDGISFRQMTSRDALEQLDAVLDLGRFQVDLKSWVRGFDRRIQAHNRVILRHAPKSEEYAGHVLEHWNEILQDPGQRLVHESEHLNAISDLFETADPNWRRREFFTRLEKLEAGKTKRPDKKDAFRTAKIGAINQAFYTEFEGMGATSPEDRVLTVNRDVTYLVDPSNVVPQHLQSTEADSYMGESLASLDAANLASIAHWHTKAGAPFDSFRDSLDTFDGFFHAAAGTLSVRQVKSALDEHVRIMNECVKAGTPKDEVPTGQKTFLAVHLPRVSKAVPTGIAAAAALSGHLVGYELRNLAVRNACVAAGLTCVGLAMTHIAQHRVKSHEWRNLEAALRRSMAAELTNAAQSTGRKACE